MVAILDLMVLEICDWLWISDWNCIYSLIRIKIFMNNEVYIVGEFKLNETDFVIKGTCDFGGLSQKAAIFILL